MIDVSCRYADSILNEKAIPEADSSALQQRYKKSSDHLRRVADIGSFVISDEAATALRDYFAVVDKEANNPNYLDAIESDYIAAKKCLEITKKAAREDLRLSPEPMRGLSTE